MSKVLIMSFTNKGVELSNLISKSIETEYDVREYAFHKYIGESNSISFTSGKDTMRTAFVEKYDYVIFIGAVAMAVRMVITTRSTVLQMDSFLFSFIRGGLQIMNYEFKV